MNSARLAGVMGSASYREKWKIVGSRTGVALARRESGADCAARRNMLTPVPNIFNTKPGLVSRVLFIVLACFTFCVGCRTPGKMSLESTIARLYKAEKANDWRTMWSLAHPLLKEGCPYEEFLAISNARKDDLRSWRIVRIDEIRDSDLILRLRGTRAVKVPMDVTIYYKDTEETTKVEDQTDYWVLQHNGNWRWYYRGWPSD